MIALLEHWVKQYPIVSIEDGLAEDDWDGWTALTARLGGSVQLIGDDLFATQAERLRQGIERGAANAILIKLNQVGHPLRDARRAPPGPPPRLPHDRLGPLGRDRGHDHRRPRRRHRRRPDQDRLGRRSERLAKYNRLLRIEAHLGPRPASRAARLLGL